MRLLQTVPSNMSFLNLSYWSQQRIRGSVVHGILSSGILLLVKSGSNGVLSISTLLLPLHYQEPMCL